MKRVRNYLREVLEMKSKEDWLKFQENLNFCGRESRSAQRQMILKTNSAFRNSVFRWKSCKGSV